MCACVYVYALYPVLKLAMVALAEWLALWGPAASMVALSMLHVYARGIQVGVEDVCAAYTQQHGGGWNCHLDQQVAAEPGLNPKKIRVR